MPGTDNCKTDLKWACACMGPDEAMKIRGSHFARAHLIAFAELYILIKPGQFAHSSSYRVEYQ